MRATYVDCIGCNAELFSEELTLRGIKFKAEGLNDNWLFVLYGLNSSNLTWIEGLNEEGITIN